MSFHSLKSTTVRFAFVICSLGLAAVVSGCGTGGGVRIGGGTATGAVAGGLYSLATQDGGRGALIGTGVGAAVDLLSGRSPLEVEPYYGQRRPAYQGYQPYYRGYQPDYRDYQQDYQSEHRSYGPVYRGYHSEYREIRRYYNSGCDCYYTD
ncbi:glycine zipper family protein [bacterium]|nr:glycine zipper family protein [bacterium]